MFDRDSNVQLGGKLLKWHYPKLKVICGVEHTVYLFFNDVYKIPIVHQMITNNKVEYNIFGSGICLVADFGGQSLDMDPNFGQ